MFDRRTVFVVGAGGSAELGLPVGLKLTGLIAGKVNIGYRNGYDLASGDKGIVTATQYFVKKAGQTDPNPYYEAGRAIAAGMPQAISIDNYMHTHAADPLVIQMGKFGIAASIIEAEQNSALYLKDQHGALAFGQIKPSWHNTFCKMLLEGADRNDPERIFDNVAFITFNYDRCIEHYVMHAVETYLRLDRATAQELTRKLTVIHPYGQIGKLPWQYDKGVSYGADLHHSQLIDIAGQIKTFTERVEDDAMMGRIHQLLSQAEVLVYLGFSYGDMNMRLMSLKNAGERVIYGTSKGLSSPNQRIVELEIVNAMGPDKAAVKSIDLADMYCLDFLDAYWKPIMRGP
jgi:hypothetical protein